MGIPKTSLMVLLISFCCTCGSPRDTHSPPPATAVPAVAQSIAYHYETPRNVLPDMKYTESWLISSATMTISRNGGTGINSGKWKIELDQEEIENVNAHLTLMLDPAVADSVFDVLVYDGPITDLFIGETIKEFHYGVVTDPSTNADQWHEFPAQVSDFVAYIDELMAEHIGSRYID